MYDILGVWWTGWARLFLADISEKTKARRDVKDDSASIHLGSLSLASHETKPRSATGPTSIFLNITRPRAYTSYNLHRTSYVKTERQSQWIWISSDFSLCRGYSQTQHPAPSTPADQTGHKIRFAEKKKKGKGVCTRGETSRGDMDRHSQRPT
jgi:hypothetical protein